MDSSFTNLSQFGCKVTQFYVNFQIIPTKNAKNLILSLMENHLPQTHKAFVSQRQALFFDSQTKTIVKTKKKSTAMFVIVFFMQNSILTHEKAYFIDVLF